MEDNAAYIQNLMSVRDQLSAQMEALRNQIEGLEIAIKLFSEGDPAPAAVPRRKAGATHTILNLLRDSGSAGLKPRATIEQAARIGVSLNRGSVYSLLNRMEKSGVVVRRDGRYRLRESVVAERTGSAETNDERRPSSHKP
jgi:hypothetical protein